MSQALKHIVLDTLGHGLSGLADSGHSLTAEHIAQLKSTVARHFDAHEKHARAMGRHDDRRAAIAQIYLSAIRRVLAHAQLEVLHKLHAGLGKIKNTTPVAADLTFDLTGFKRSFFAEMRKAGTQALAVSGQGMLSELGIDQKYVTPQGIISDFIIARKNKLGGVPDEIYERIKSDLEAGSQKGETMDQLADRVKARFAAIDAGRAQVIATTETATAYGQGRMDALTQAGFTHKSWLTAGDEKVRLSHNQAQEQGAIPNDEAFDNGLMFPGDPDGPADEVINCRCVLQAAENPEPEEGAE